MIIISPAETYDKILSVFKLNLYVFIANISLGLFGIGYNSYGDMGYKGFFYAGNELSGIVIVLYPFFINYVIEKYSYKSIKTILCILFLVFTASLIGTKTSLVVVVISIIVIYNFSGKRKSNRISKSFFFILLASLIVYGCYYLISHYGMLDRWLFFYEKGGLDMLLLSGRGEYWMEEKGEYLNSGFVRILLGLGGAKTVEIDPFDALLNYGIIGFCMLYSFYGYLFYISFKRRNNSRISKLIFFINCLLLLASSVSGHILYSGMAGVFIALVNVISFLPVNKLIDKQSNKVSNGNSFILKKKMLSLS